MNCLEMKRQARSGVDGVFRQPVRLRGAWMEQGRFAAALWGWWLLSLASALLPSTVMSWPLEGSRWRRDAEGGDSGSRSHFIQMTEAGRD